MKEKNLKSDEKEKKESKSYKKTAIAKKLVDMQIEEIKREFRADKRKNIDVYSSKREEKKEKRPDLTF